MQIITNTPSSSDSLIHHGDARVKLILLLVYSLTLFFVRTWIGLGIAVVACVILCAVARIPLRYLFGILLPLYVILAGMLIANSFTFTIEQSAQRYGLGDVSAGLFEGFAPLSLWGSFGFIPEGFARACFYVLRIIFLVFASLVVSFTTSTTDLVEALSDFLRPLRKIKVPTEDIAMMISIALRFIPLMAEEVHRVHAAQQSRGAVFDEGGPLVRIRAWQPVIIPLFVGLFRRAHYVAIAMDARCYGLSPVRSRLHPHPFTLASAGILIGGCFACGVLAFFF